MKCYNDGSRLNNRTGYGYCITQDDYQISSGHGYLGENTTVFQAEIVGIHRACLELSKYEGDVTIFTDSQASMDAISTLKTKSSTVANCVRELNNLASGRKVQIKWVKSHSDFTGNETADAEAKAGTLDSKREAIPLPVSFVRAKIKDFLTKMWTHEWENSNSCRQTKIWLPVVIPSISNALMNMGRLELSLLVQTITGHNRLRRHESLMNEAIDPICRLCAEDEETSWHLVGECPALWQQRMDIFHTHYLESPEGSVFQLLRMINQSQIREMLLCSENCSE